MARSYKRDAKGRFASSGSSGKSAKSASQSSASSRARKGRSIEARIERSSKVLMDYRRFGDSASPMNPQRFRNMGKRVQQQKQAIANLYGGLSPAGKKRANTAMKRTRVMNG